MTRLEPNSRQPAPGPGTPAGNHRALRLFLWIKRYDFLSAQDVDRIVERAAGLGLTDLVWQVRGQADAFYRSSLEARGQEIASSNFDPLATALEAVARHGLRLHAWVNAMPLWKGPVPPASPEHLYHTHPQWRMRDRQNREQPLNPHYVIVNFCLEEVREHIAAVCRDIAERYAVNGLHLDYIRFVSETMGDSAVFPGDPRSLALFASETGHETASPETPDFRAAFDDWRRSKVTALVRLVRREVKLARPAAELSAAVWRRPDLGHDRYLQPAAQWANEELLDLFMPMIYTENPAQFLSDIAAWKEAVPDHPRRMVVGLGAYKLDGPGLTEQLEALHGPVCLFDYSAFEESRDPGQLRTDAAAAKRAERRAAWLTWVESGRTRGER